MSKARFRDICLRRVDRVTAEFQEYVGSVPRLFVEDLVASYLGRVANGHGEDYKDLFSTPVIYISALRQRCYLIQQKFWETFGAGPEYDQIRQSMNYMRQVECWVEDVLCEAMVCNTRLERMYASRELAYQNVS